VKASEWSKALRKELIDDKGLIAVAVSHRKLVVKLAVVKQLFLLVLA
jgi:hypothetical protein